MAHRRQKAKFRRCPPKRVRMWWVKPPKGCKLTAKQKHTRAVARARSYGKRVARQNRRGPRWINSAMRRLDISRERATRLWDGSEHLTDDQAITLLQYRR